MTTPEPPYQAINLALNLYNEVNTYWAYYLSVAAIIFGLISSGKIELTKNIKLALSIFFFTWALSNLAVILSLAEQRRASIELVLNLIRANNQQATAPVAVLMEEIKPRCDAVYIAYHGLIDCVVFYVLWFFKPKTP